MARSEGAHRATTAHQRKGLDKQKYALWVYIVLLASLPLASTPAPPLTAARKIPFTAGAAVSSELWL